MRSRDGFEGLDTGKLAFERPIMVEAGAMDNFNGPINPKPITRNPHLAISARGDRADQFVLRNDDQAKDFGLGGWTARAHVDGGECRKRNPECRPTGFELDQTLLQPLNFLLEQIA